MIAGVGKQPLDSLIREAARMICALCGHPVDGSEQQKRGDHQHERMYARLFHL